MTTVCVDLVRGVIAADGQMSNDMTKWQAVKIHKVRKVWVATCGIAVYGEQFEAWLANPKKTKPVLGDEFEALVCYEDGRVAHFTDTLSPVPIEASNRFFAVGSGAHAALGALKAGATLELALEIACSIDPMSGPPFQFVTYKKEKVV